MEEHTDSDIFRRHRHPLRTPRWLVHRPEVACTVLHNCMVGCYLPHQVLRTADLMPPPTLTAVPDLLSMPVTYTWLEHDVLERGAGWRLSATGAGCSAALRELVLSVVHDVTTDLSRLPYLLYVRAGLAGHLARHVPMPVGRCAGGPELVCGPGPTSWGWTDVAMLARGKDWQEPVRRRPVSHRRPKYAWWRCRAGRPAQQPCTCCSPFPVCRHGEALSLLHRPTQTRASAGAKNVRGRHHRKVACLELYGS